jgi:hypothetical protein
MANANTVGTLDLIWSAGFLLGLVYVIRGLSELDGEHQERRGLLFAWR